MKAKHFNTSTANSLRQRPSFHYIAQPSCAQWSPDLWQGFVAPAATKTINKSSSQGPLKWREDCALSLDYFLTTKFHREVTIASHYHERFTFKERQEESWSPEKPVFFTLSASTWVQISDICQRQNKETRCWYIDALKEIKNLIKMKGLATELGLRAERIRARHDTNYRNPGRKKEGCWEKGKGHSASQSLREVTYWRGDAGSQHYLEPHIRKRLWCNEIGSLIITVGFV